MGQSSSKASTSKASKVLFRFSAQRWCLVKIQAEGFDDFLAKLREELAEQWTAGLGALPSLEALEVRHEGCWQPFREWHQVAERTELRVAEPVEPRPVEPRVALAESIASWRDCRVGERVQVLPRHLAEGPTQASTANWTRACCDHAGQQASIVEVDGDNTINLRFDDGEELWYSVQSCTKTLGDPPLPLNVEAWVKGAGMRGASLNGVFLPDKPVDGFPSFRNPKTGGVIYCKNFWKMSPSSLTGWLYSVLGESELPPEGHWTTHGYGGRDVLPAPEVWLCEPYDIYVETGAAAGRYCRKDIQNERPLYLLEGGAFAISWAEGAWKLSDGQSEWSLRSYERYPPEGPWEGKLGSVVLRRELLTVEAPKEEVGIPIQRVADCSVGEGVRLLPLHLSEQPTRDSTATWTELCAAYCGKSGFIQEIDRDETIRVRFKDDRQLWLSVRSCAKTGEIEPNLFLQAIVSGAEGRGARLNGTYEPDGEENGKPLYRHVDGNGVLYAGRDNTWRLSPGSLGGWFFIVDSPAPVPPENGWTTEGFNGKDVSGTPIVKLERMPERPQPAPRVDSSSTETSSEASVDLGADIPDVIWVRGAGGQGASCNGEYRVEGNFKQRPKYKQVGGQSIVYFHERWKINFRDDLGGWYYSAPERGLAPPARVWTTDGYYDDDANPAPTVTHGPGDASPISDIGECEPGMRVRILPAAQAAPAQQRSPAAWNEDCLAHCGDVGEIAIVANDGTIRVAFEEGDSHWFAIGACAKEI